MRERRELQHPGKDEFKPPPGWVETPSGNSSMVDQLTPDERRFRALASSSVERIAEIDAQGRFVYVSPNHAAARDDLLASLDSVIPEDQVSVAASFIHAFESGNASSISFRVHNLTGELRWVESTLTPFAAADGERHVLVVSRDVTEGRRIERELRESRERFQVIAENAYDMIVEYDSEWKLRYANDRAHAVFGIAEPDFASRLDTNFDYVHPDNRARIKANFQLVNSGELDVVDATYRTRRADGSWCWIDATLRKYTAADGEPHFLVIARDVTARVAAEQGLRESERRYRELVEHAPLGIFVVQDGNVVFANATAAAIYGAGSPEDLCARGMSALLDARTAQDVASGLARSGAGDPRGYNFAIDWTGPSGQRRHLAAVGTVISYAGAPAFQCIVRDVTELERSRRDQEHLSLQLQEARKLESLGVLAGGIAHDFNNLLAVILSSVRYARSSDTTAVERGEALGDAEEATESAARLVKQLLAYAGRRSPEVCTVELSELARSLTNLLSTALPNGVGLEIDTAHEAIQVHADVVQLEQVLMNLVLNAADAVGDGPGKVRVRTSRQHLGAEQLAHWLGGEELSGGWYACLEVEDSGVGMDAETRAHIFEPFFSTKQDGHGLGLSAVLGLVQGHRGAIQVDSEPGRGTRMRVFLPADASPAPIAPRRAPILLVAEPASGLRGSAAETLRGAGMEVIEANDAARALQLWAIHGDDLDAAVIDGVFCAADGRPLVALLHAARPELPMLALCAGDEHPLAVEREGLTAFVRRPFTGDTLRERVAGLLAKRDAQR
jgi:PAS domain S-box-containing protein